MNTRSDGTTTSADDDLIREVVEQAAYRMGLTVQRIEAAMAGSAWSGVAGLVVREFDGPYRCYFPKCDMSILGGAVVAEIFDAIAIRRGDTRRALRVGAWVPPSAPTGGRSDG